ncbi:hypothetical protein QBC36DRAFT_250419 [Triangularia setosa]|uniref:Uncharacterized protein n=1 Tax=Triangularia setosa TaxID=2587417 RepID=A0AAN6VWF5_9PEZI|nr:hypothetical protein QBC36DRAFT_250419 [Podospora setosa]
MAKKSKRNHSRKTQPQRPYLRRSDKIKVVACLDYSLEHSVDLTSVAISNLDSLKDYEYDVAYKAIRGALKGEYRDYGRCDGDVSFEAFLAEGSVFLRYGKDDPETLRAERSHIRSPLRTRYLLRSTPRTSTSRTRTSSILSSRLPTRSETSSLSVHSSLEFEDSVYTIAEQTPRAATTTLSLRPSHETGKKSSATATALLTSTKQESYPTQATEIAETASLLLLQNGIQKDRLNMLEGELAAKNEELAAKNEELAAKNEELAAKKEELAAKNDELQAALRSNAEQQEYNFTLHNRLKAAEKECQEIEHSINKAAEHQHNAVVQENLRYECSVLRDQNIKMVSQREAISLAAKRSLGSTNQNIREEFELILAGLKDACSSVDITIPTTGHTVDDINQEDTVEHWSQRLVSSSLCGLGSHVSANDISDIHFMAALAAVGIAELVFESNFPNFLARESPLLDQYREHILLKAGPQTLSELDLLAYHSILSASEDQDDSYFQSHILTKNARSLSSKLVSVIAGLICSSDETAIDASPTTLPGQRPHHLPTAQPHTETSNAIVDYFIEPIFRALKLKANLLLTRSKYTLVYPRPGDRFNPATMVRNGESQHAPRFAPRKGRDVGHGQVDVQRSGHGVKVGGGVEEVKLCLFPGLYAKREEEILERQYGVGVNVRNCLIECSNFVNNLEREDDDETQGFLSVVRAVVLV